MFKRNTSQLAIFKSSSGLGLVACMEGQKKHNMPNIACRKFFYIPNVFVQPESNNYNKASFNIYLARSL